MCAIVRSLTAAACLVGALAAAPGSADEAGSAPAPEARPLAAMPAEQQLDFRIGRAVFDRPWAPAPSGTRSSGGLGPLFNARACASCHPAAGRAPMAGDFPAGLVVEWVRGSGAAPEGEPADPVYGDQLQRLAVAGVSAEARAELVWEEVAGRDGTSLGRPRLALSDLAYGPLADSTAPSPRLAPALYGAGLIDAVPEAEILARADPDDADGDGISGRASRLRGPNGSRLGRFGWRAGQADLADQTARAFHIDMGLSARTADPAAGDCTDAQAACRAAPHGAAAGEAEIRPELVAVLATYLRYLAPLEPRPRDAEAERGAALFDRAGCAACHRPALTAGGDDPALAGRTVRAYTDLLLHDMGLGLADRLPDGTVVSTEWRTAPLWGIGAAAAGEARPGYLHDGRARTLAEAILWHGGEADAAAARFADLNEADRRALVRFLEGL